MMLQFLNYQIIQIGSHEISLQIQFNCKNQDQDIDQIVVRAF